MKSPLTGLMKERRSFANEEIKNGRGGRQKRTCGGRRGFSDGDPVYPSESGQGRAVLKA